METHDSADEYRWELPPTVLQKLREALAAEPEEPSDTPPPVVRYSSAA